MYLNDCIVHVQQLANAVKKLPPPTKAKPKLPTQETVKKPVLPPTATAIASSNLANVLKEGKKVANQLLINMYRDKKYKKVISV